MVQTFPPLISKDFGSITKRRDNNGVDDNHVSLKQAQGKEDKSSRLNPAKSLDKGVEARVASTLRSFTTKSNLKDKRRFSLSYFTDYLCQPLLLATEMPEWAVQNPFITRGYRQINGSFRDCLASCTYIHNESGNVLTHGVGVIVYLWLWFRTASAMLDTTSSARKVPFSDFAILMVYFASIVTCLGTSTCFHMNCAHSHCMSVRLNKLDYVGILSNIVGTFTAVIYFGFYIHPHLIWLYNGIMAVLGICCVFVVVSKYATSPELHAFRTLLFTLLGCFGVVPVTHALFLYGGIEGLNQKFNGGYVAIGGAMYLIGAAFYFYRIPERFKPGIFDYWGNSHQIFHLLVLGGCLCHYTAISLSMAYWYSIVGLPEIFERSM